MNCPLCGKDTIYVDLIPFHFCEDTECAGHDFVFEEKFDPGEIKYLAITTIRKSVFFERMKEFCNIISGE